MDRHMERDPMEPVDHQLKVHGTEMAGIFLAIQE
jgi:hypothetical protein